MTKEEREKRAEEKARRKAELAERSARRKAQLAALGKYWVLLRYNLNGRACPQDFFLFWVRQLLFASQKMLYFIVNYGGGFIRFVYLAPIIIIVVGILCFLFPPLLFILQLLLLSFAIGVVWIITAVLLFAATYTPIFLAIIKRRINDVSKTAIAAHAKFVLFVVSGAIIVPSLAVCCLSWCKVGSFTPGETLSWMVDIAYTLLLAGVALIVYQMHYYSYKAGVEGENFAGENPLEITLTEEFLGAQGGRGATRLWQVFSLVLLACAAGASFALSSLFIKGVRALSQMDIGFSIAGVAEFVPFLVYLMQSVTLAACILIVMARARYKKGDLGRSEVASIDECFSAKTAEDVSELRERATLAAEEESRKHPSAVKSIGRLMGLVIMATCSIFYYSFLIYAIVYLFKGSLVLFLMLIAMAFAVVGYYSYSRSNEGQVDGKVNWASIISDSCKRLLCYLRNVVLLPFMLPDGKSSDNTDLPTIAEKRLKVRNLSFIDPLGIHQLALGEMELGGIQILFCLMIVGIPISWLWSVFDGIRLSKMTDEEFLIEYPDYCFSKGLMDKIVRFLNKIAVLLAPIAAAIALLAFAMLLNDSSNGVNDSSNHGASRSACICVDNMKKIQLACEMEYLKSGKKITDVADVWRLGYTKKELKCPSGGKYQICDDGKVGKVTCSSGKEGHVIEE